jgi:hypothetical protein
MYMNQASSSNKCRWRESVATSCALQTTHSRSWRIRGELSYTPFECKSFCIQLSLNSLEPHPKHNRHATFNLKKLD